MSDVPATLAQEYDPAVPVGKLEPHPRNVNEGDVGAIASTMDELGFFGACLVQRSTSRIIAGKHRWLAAKAEGKPDVPVLWADVDDDTAVRIMLADNRTARLGRDDGAALAALLTELASTPRALAGTAYDGDALDELLADLAAQQQTPGGDGEIIEPPAKPVTRRGDLWELGDHRLLCGDATDAEAYRLLLETARVDIAFTSPPYADRRKYDPTSGFRPVPPDQYVQWFAPVAHNVAVHLALAGSWFVNIKEQTHDGERDLYVLDLVLAHSRDWHWRFVDALCWDHGAFPGAFPDRFSNAWEPVYHFTHADSRPKFHPLAVGHPSEHVMRYETATRTALGDGGGGVTRGNRPRTGGGIARPSNVVRVGSGGDGTHPAAFPVALPVWFLRAYSDVDDVVLDPFGGSGSTLIAAEQEHRGARLIEISPAYCDVICRRYQTLTGTKPVRDGKPHDFT